MNNYPKNITLIGMPFSGKSTIGKLLFKKLNYHYIDLDSYIEEKFNMKLSDIVIKFGNIEFKKIEEEAILDMKGNNIIISTGGSVIYSQKGMEHLKKISNILFLNVKLDELVTRMNKISMEERAIVFEEGQTFEKLYEERIPLYKKYCDREIICDSLSQHEILKKII